MQGKGSVITKGVGGERRSFLRVHKKKSDAGAAGDTLSLTYKRRPSVRIAVRKSGERDSWYTD